MGGHPDGSVDATFRAAGADLVSAAAGGDESAAAAASRRLAEADELDPSTSARRDVLDALVQVLPRAIPPADAVVALTLGGFVESGLSPRNVLPAIEGCARRALAAWSSVLQATDDDDGNAEWEAPPELRCADRAVLALIACLTRDSEARSAARADAELRSLAHATSENAGFWLHRLLVAAPSEEWVVLHWPSSRGYVVRVEELVDNWPIQVLLADALVTERRGPFGLGGMTGPKDGIPGTRFDPRVVACFRGEGPQSIRLPITTPWEAYTFRALSSGKLEEGLLHHKVWNEGVPRDIPMLDGHRLVVLGERRIERSFNVGRAFGALGSRMGLVRVLERDEVRAWIERCRSTA